MLEIKDSKIETPYGTITCADFSEKLNNITNNAMPYDFDIDISARNRLFKCYALSKCLEHEDFWTEKNLNKVLQNDESAVVSMLFANSKFQDFLRKKASKKFADNFYETINVCHYPLSSITVAMSNIELPHRVLQNILDSKTYFVQFVSKRFKKYFENFERQAINNLDHSAFTPAMPFPAYNTLFFLQYEPLKNIHHKILPFVPNIPSVFPSMYEFDEASVTSILSFPNNDAANINLKNEVFGYNFSKMPVFLPAHLSYEIISSYIYELNIQEKSLVPSILNKDAKKLAQFIRNNKINDTCAELIIKMLENNTGLSQKDRFALVTALSNHRYDLSDSQRYFLVKEFFKFPFSLTKSDKGIYNIKSLIDLINDNDALQDIFLEASNGFLNFAHPRITNKLHNDTTVCFHKDFLILSQILNKPSFYFTLTSLFDNDLHKKFHPYYTLRLLCSPTIDRNKAKFFIEKTAHINNLAFRDDFLKFREKIMEACSNGYVCYDVTSRILEYLTLKAFRNTHPLSVDNVLYNVSINKNTVTNPNKIKDADYNLILKGEYRANIYLSKDDAQELVKVIKENVTDDFINNNISFKKSYIKLRDGLCSDILHNIDIANKFKESNLFSIDIKNEEPPLTPCRKCFESYYDASTTVRQEMPLSPFTFNIDLFDIKNDKYDDVSAVCGLLKEITNTSDYIHNLKNGLKTTFSSILKNSIMSQEDCIYVANNIDKYNAVSSAIKEIEKENNMENDEISMLDDADILSF